MVSTSIAVTSWSNWSRLLSSLLFGPAQPPIIQTLLQDSVLDDIESLSYGLGVFRSCYGLEYETVPSIHVATVLSHVEVQQLDGGVLLRILFAFA